ncbi:hypothetical protein Salat_1888400 [Sesamum alatum]|uniref:Uncharacterized protein n=1 Tax=Sesamum alatum TaxID=300844 RepID=A0AAE1Y4P4_9LAMI|nr:hypothetical protein Salat_1888400 [Sesamum alatum]
MRCSLRNQVRHPQEAVVTYEPEVPTDIVPVLRRSARVSHAPDRYGFLGLTGQLDNDPKTYGEAMSDIDSDKWLEAMKFEMDSMERVRSLCIQEDQWELSCVSGALRG